MKLDDIPFVIHDINSQMPLLTNETVKIPSSYGNFPKNLMREAKKANHKSNNNLVSIIEEVAHCYPNHPLPLWMKHYQNTYFKADLIHDRFFKTDDEFGMPYNTRYSLPFTGMSLGFGTVAVVPHVNGADLQTTTGVINQGGGWDGQVYAWIVSGIAGQYYDQMALNTNSVSGSIRQGVYDDSAGSPNNFISNSDTGSYTISSSSYTLTNCSAEFSLPTNSIWLAFQSNTAGDSFLGDTSITAKYHTQGYGAFVNPFTVTNTLAQTLRMKLHHT